MNGMRRRNGYGVPAKMQERDGRLTFYNSLGVPDEKTCERQYSPLGNVTILRVEGVFAGACYPKARDIIRENRWVTTIDLHRRILNYTFFELAALLEKDLISWEQYKAEVVLLDRARMCLRGYYHKMSDEASERLFRR